MALVVTLVEDEIAVGDAVYTHVQDRFVTHAYCHASVAHSFVAAAVLASALLPATFQGVEVLVVFSLAARAFQMLVS